MLGAVTPAGAPAGPDPPSTPTLLLQWISDHRIVLSAGTFTRWLILLFAPRLWVAGRLLASPG